jgi:hypothetical protein
LNNTPHDVSYLQPDVVTVSTFPTHPCEALARNDATEVDSAPYGLLCEVHKQGHERPIMGQIDAAQPWTTYRLTSTEALSKGRFQTQQAMRAYHCTTT